MLLVEEERQGDSASRRTGQGSSDSSECPMCRIRRSIMIPINVIREEMMKTVRTEISIFVNLLRGLVRRCSNSSAGSFPASLSLRLPKADDEESAMATGAGTFAGARAERRGRPLGVLGSDIVKTLINTSSIACGKQIH